MTTYYVDPNNGNNANNGLGPDASHASNKPWQTLAKLLGASGMASGDTAYLAPGTYREAVAVAMTSATVTTSVIGDPGNAQGFKTSGGALVAPGDVIWTAYTTNDTTTPSTSPTLDLAGRDFLLFQYILFIGGNTAAAGSVVRGTTTNSVNITLRDCAFIGSVGQTLVNYVGLADVASNWTMDRCTLFAPNPIAPIDITLPTSTSADYDTNFLIQNCVLLGGNNQQGVTIASSGANSFKGGGVDVLNCTIQGFQLGVRTSGTNLSTSIPCTVNNSLIVNCSTGLSAGASGQITEDYCRIIAGTPRTNVSAGANSVSTVAHAFLVEIGQAAMMGRGARAMFTPTAGSPLLGFGSTGAPSVDMLNRTRPSGGASTSNAVGAYERHEIATKETSVTQAGATSWKLTGPGDHDMAIPVDATSTTITIYARYDTTHAATNKPQAILLANGEIGVSTETKTMTAAADTWEQLTFSSFTPSAKGYVTIRLVSRAAAGGGIAYFDTVAGGASSTSGFDYFRASEPLSTIVNSTSLKVHPGMDGGMRS